MRRAIFLFVMSGCAAAQQASLDGIATNALTHEPLSGVHVRLVGIRSFQAPSFDLYGAASDRAGHFSVSAIKPGNYILMPEFRGFIYGQTREGGLPYPSVALKAGEHRSDFKLEMMPEAVIVGRVLDEFGDPMANVQVTAEAVSKDIVVATAGMGMLGAVYGRTDDRGIFRIVGFPGKYFLQAAGMMAPFNSGPPEIRADGSSPTEYKSSYFPGVASKDSAGVVEARAGSEVTGIDIRVVRADRQSTFSISGTVSGLAAGEGNFSVQVQPVESRQFYGGPRTSIEQGGKFTVRGVAPGTYRVTPMVFSTGNPQYGPPVEVKVENSDVTNLDLRMTGGGDIAGTIEIAGDPPDQVKEKRTIRLQAVKFWMYTTPSAESDRDGAFHIANLGAGRFRVEVDPLPEDAYVKTVELDGSVVADGILELHGTGGSRLKIVISRKGARITGIVRGKDGEPLVNTMAMVLLVDDIEKLSMNRAEGAHIAQAEADGKFEFKGVKPGKYRLVAVDIFRSPDVEEQDVLKKRVAALEEFEVKEDDRISKDVTALGKEEAGAKKQ